MGIGSGYAESRGKNSTFMYDMGRESLIFDF
jgi:hypothetical protein